MSQLIITDAEARLQSALAAFGKKLKGNPGNDSEILKTIKNHFDAAWYLFHYPDVKASGIDPLLHYLKYGIYEGRFPCPDIQHIFDLFSDLDADKTQKSEGSNFSSRPLPSLNPEKYEIIRYGTYETLYGRPLFINWIMTSLCNYDCSYCFGHGKISKSNLPPMTNLIRGLESIERLSPDSYDIALTGGEVTALPYFNDFLYLLVSRLDQKIKHIEIYSNGFRDYTYFNSICDILKNLSCSILISIHTDHARSEHIYELVSNMSGNVHLNLSLMFNPAKFELVKELYQNLFKLREKKFFELSIVTLRQPPAFALPDKRYTQEHFDWQKEKQEAFDKLAVSSKLKSPLKNLRYRCFWDIKDKSAGETATYTIDIKHQASSQRQTMFLNGFYNFKDIYCIGGTHMLALNPDGSISTMRCGGGRIIGNYLKDDGRIAVQPAYLFKCLWQGCGCAANDPCLKFRAKNEAEEFVRIANSIRKGHP